MHPSGRFQEFHVEKNVMPLPTSSGSDPVWKISGENNFTVSNQPSHSPASVMECGFSRGPNINQNHSCRDDTFNGFASSQPEAFSNSIYPNEKGGYWTQNNVVAPWHHNERCHETTGHSVYTSSVAQLQPVQWEDPSIPKVSTVPLSFERVNQFKAYGSNAPMEKPCNEGNVEDFPRYGHSGHHGLNINASEDNSHPSLKRPLLLENLQSRPLDPRMPSVGMGERPCFQAKGQFESSHSVLEKSGAYKVLSDSNSSIDNRQSLELCKEHVNVHSQLKIASGYSGGILANNAVKGDAEIVKTLSSVASSLMQPLKEEIPAKNNEEWTSSTRAVDIASNAIEKLWSGTVQLTSSVKSQADAYFKSGDKMPDIHWSDSVEVKGKVRLEAFEKYIQDLPRSRNRGLMVISLCLREESFKDGLKGVNEVAKKYNDGNRIGFAHLSPGVDVYICPNNETIITILAKNGFFKGMVAVQDHQDSLIGCVVWRKNSNSDPIAKNLDNEPLSGHHLTSPPNSNPQQVTGSSSSPAKPQEEAAQQATMSIQEQSKNSEPPDLQTIHGIVKQLSEIEASIFQSLGIEKLQGNLELLKNILPPPSGVIKQSVPPADDDDLPEYDFSAAIPHTSTSNASEAKVSENKHIDEGFRCGNELVSSSQMCADSQKGALFGSSLPQKRKAQVIGLDFTSSPAVISNNTTMLGSKPKNLFDEDDMPEWLPPDMEPLKPSTNQNAGMPFIPNTHRPPSEGQHYPVVPLPCAPRHSLSLTPPVAIPPPAPPQRLPPPPLRPPPAQIPYLNNNPGSASKFNPNPTTRPEHRMHDSRAPPMNRDRRVRR